MLENKWGFVDLNGKMLLMDCGDRHRPPGVLRVSALNNKGYLIKKKEINY